MVLSRKAVADFNRYVWWARKPTDASSYGQGNDPVHDEEDLESDEEDRGHHATNITNVPLPSATDATQASVEQLAALAVSTDEQEREKPAASSTYTVRRKGPSCNTAIDIQEGRGACIVP
jgi:hypothetical protein